MRGSKLNGSGSPNLTLSKSLWVGFNRIFHSPRTAAEGRARAIVCSASIQASPKRRSDSSRVLYQADGGLFESNLAVSISSGISPSIDTRSFAEDSARDSQKVSMAANASELEAYTTRTPRLFQRPPYNLAPSPVAASAAKQRRQIRQNRINCIRHRLFAQRCLQLPERLRLYRVDPGAARLRALDSACRAIERLFLRRQSSQLR